MTKTGSISWGEEEGFFIIIKIKESYANVWRTEFVSIRTIAKLIFSFPTLEISVTMVISVVQLLTRTPTRPCWHL